MDVFVKFEVFDTITKTEEIADLRQAVSSQVQKVESSGKMKSGGIFADGRAGFFLLDVETSEEVLELLGSGFLDHCRVESHPLVPFEKLAAFFSREGDL